MTKSYIYTDTSRILCQRVPQVLVPKVRVPQVLVPKVLVPQVRNGGQAAAEYFYVTDRLGSVRQLIDDTGSVVRNYTYSPFGQLLEQGQAGGAPTNPYMFTGQWFDDEIEQYYLRARMYDPNMMRFTARDPVRGKFKNPMTLHKYLYCTNDPTNKIDPSGEVWGTLISADMRIRMAGVSLSVQMIATHLVNALNARAMLMYSQLQDGFDLATATAVASVHNTFANVALHGYKAMAFISAWNSIDPGGPADVGGVLIGDPHLPQSVSGWMAYFTKEGTGNIDAEKLADGFSDWWDEVQDEYFTDKDI